MTRLLVGVAAVVVLSTVWAVSGLSALEAKGCLLLTFLLPRTCGTCAAIQRDVGCALTTTPRPRWIYVRRRDGVRARHAAHCMQGIPSPTMHVTMHEVGGRAKSRCTSQMDRQISTQSYRCESVPVTATTAVTVVTKGRHSWSKTTVTLTLHRAELQADSGPQSARLTCCA
jgi:hypothetical protein